MIVILVDSLGSGGAQRQINFLLQGLSSHNEVKIFAYNDTLSNHYNIDKKYIDCFVRNSTNNYVSKVQSMLWLGKRLWYTKTCISFQSNANFISVIFNLIFFFKYKTIISERTDIRRYSKSQLFLNWLTYKLANNIVVNSNFNYNYILQNYNNRVGGKLVLINNAVCDPLHVKTDFERTNVLLYVGRINRVKNVINLMNAITALNKSGQNLKLIICGRADLISTEDKQYYYRFQSIINRDNKENKWFDYRGEVDANNIPFDEVDALISVSSFEGASNSISEALSANCPVMSTKVGQHTEFIELGLIHEICSTSELDIKDGISNFYSKKELEISDISFRAKNIVIDMFDRDKMITSFTVLIR